MNFKTRAEAEKHRYGAWAGFAGHAFDPGLCAEDVMSGFRGAQCTRKPGYGPDKLYCKQHDPARIKARQAERDRVWREKQDRENRIRAVQALGPLAIELADLVLGWATCPTLTERENMVAFARTIRERAPK